MLIRIRRTRTHPAADWTSANPWLEPLEMGIEEEAPHKAKLNVSDVRVRWNSLDYWSPGGSGVQIVTTTVQTNVGTKQALLAAVPTGKVRIVTQAVARNASEDLTDMPDDLGFGFTAGASGWAGSLSAAWAELANNARVVYIPAANQSSAPAGIAGEIFGCIFYDTSITATLDIDVHYYDVDA